MTDHNGIWRSIEIACEPGFEDVAEAYVFRSGFSGSMEREEDGRSVITAYYQVQPGEVDPVDVFNSLIEAVQFNELQSIPIHVICQTDVPEEDWEVRWRDGLGVVETGDRIAVRPSWVPYDNADSRIEIIIDPRMAFGTGGHSTTRLCLEAMEHTEMEGVRILDAGCGSGVLSIAGAKLGVSACYGFDYDEASVSNARDNLVINRVGNHVIIESGDLGTVVPGQYDIVFANMISSILVRHLHRFHTFLSPGGFVLFSGILDEEEAMFTRHLSAQGFMVDRVDHADEWISIQSHPVTAARS